VGGSATSRIAAEIGGLLTSKLLAYREILRYAAFTEDGTGGHPARVGLDAIGLSSEEMQTIAAQVSNSETAFITERRDAGRIIVRYFRPLAQVLFSGHATIALSAAFAEGEGAAELS
jgi:PhzF family phenazine biosynthesis protein